MGAIGDIHVSGLGDSFIDKVNGGKAEQQQGDVTFAGEVDRVYTAPEPTSLIMIRCWGGSSKLTINTIATWWPGTAGSPFRNRSRFRRRQLSELCVRGDGAGERSAGQYGRGAGAFTADAAPAQVLSHRCGGAQRPADRFLANAAPEQARRQCYDGTQS